MTRKNIFQLVEQNYNIQNEIIKIEKMFYENCYLYNDACKFSLSEIIENHLFDNWKYRGTCLDIDEFFERANALLNNKNSSEDTIINYLEIMENFIKLYKDNSEMLRDVYNIGCYDEFYSVFVNLIETLEKKMGLVKRTYSDKVIIYPKNAPLEKVIDLCTDEDVQWELIRYVREELSLAEKRKSLAFLATNLYIEEDKNESNQQINSIIKKATNILNNLHIRHNNQTGKWQNDVLNEIDEDDANSLCDMVYNEMLTIVLLRENKRYDEIYIKFQNKQKEAKTTEKEI